MRKKMVHKMITAAAAMGMALMVPFAAEAASITSVSINISSEDDQFVVGSYSESDIVDVSIPNSSAEKYHVVDWDFVDEDVAYLTTASAPKLEIILETSEDNTFSLTKASQVKLSGDTKPTYVDGKKRDEGEQLVIYVQLNSLIGKAGMVEDVQWIKEQPGHVKFYSVGKNGFQIKLLRDGEQIPGYIELPIDASVADLNPYMLVPGKYTMMIREYNPVTHSRGVWLENEFPYVVDETIAAANRGEFGYLSRNGLGWQKDEKGWWYKTPSGFAANQWLKDNGHEFWMDAEGYMVTGWQEIGGQMYYFNESGEKQVNTTTPDGAVLDENGVKIS
ncbi:MAG: hypothetical protein J5947_07875 [Clostridium sp.]|nr:hypothetical protein [Clostridium sp.]